MYLANVVVSRYHDQVQRIADLRFTVRDGRFTRTGHDPVRPGRCQTGFLSR
ncbi:hypothetical protein ACLG6S_00680 [Thermodesulfobacteriota bacterium B35]